MVTGGDGCKRILPGRSAQGVFLRRSRLIPIFSWDTSGRL
jgi:hypothetical protein